MHAWASLPRYTTQPCVTLPGTHMPCWLVRQRRRDDGTQAPGPAHVRCAGRHAHTPTPSCTHASVTVRPLPVHHRSISLLRPSVRPGWQARMLRASTIGRRSSKLSLGSDHGRLACRLIDDLMLMPLHSTGAVRSTPGGCRQHATPFLTLPSRLPSSPI